MLDPCLSAPEGISYDGKAWYIASRGPSEHEAIGNIAEAGTSEPTTSAIGKVS